MALADLPDSGSANFERVLRSTLDTWKDSIETKISSAHSHDGALLYLTLATDLVSLGSGSVTGELGVAQDTLRLYTWDESGTTWNLVSNKAFDLIQFQTFT